MPIITAVIALGCIGAVGAVVLYTVARKFHVHTDPRITQINELLPGANCGGCGRKGCADFAATCVEQGSLDDLFCPVGGNQVMKQIADVLGCSATEGDRKIAVLKCAGTPLTKTPLGTEYIGPKSCAVMAMTAGEYQCLQSCLGCGDCMNACTFSAITMAPETHLPVVDTDACRGCGECVAACPRKLFELRPIGLRERRVWVACSNCAKGALTRKQCTVGCIACGLCVKQCPFEAITITGNHAYIDPAKCKDCGKCVPVCPTGAIHSNNIKIVKKDESKDV